MPRVAETIEQSARRIGRHAWAEMRLFEILGRWSGTVAEPRARALFAAHSRHHAWHAELWHGLLPAVPHLVAADLVAPGEADAAMVAALEALDDPGDDATDEVGSGAAGDAREGAKGAAASTTGTDAGRNGPDGAEGTAAATTTGTDAGRNGTELRVAAVYREALPHLVRSYTSHLELATPITDGPTIRVLRLVLADLDRDRAAGDALVDALGPAART